MEASYKIDCRLSCHLLRSFLQKREVEEIAAMKSSICEMILVMFMGDLLIIGSE
jgi:hypothetical protein